MAEPEAAYAVDQAVLRDRVVALYGHRPQALFVGVAFLAIFVWTFRSHVDGWQLVMWSAGMLLMTLHGLYWWLDFRRAAAQPGWQPLAHLRLYTLQSWLAGVLFGLTGWLFYDPAFGDARWIAVMLLCALAGGTVTVYAYHVPTYLGFLLMLAAPLALRFWDIGAPGGWVAYALMAFYMVTLAGLVRRQGSLLIDGLRVRHEKAALALRLAEQARELARAQDAKARFFAAASHDLRQPLQALGYYTDLLRPGPPDLPHVERIRECVESLDSLLEGILTISRLDAGEVPCHPCPVDLSAMLHRLVALYGGVAAAKGLQLRVCSAVGTRRSGAASVWVETDPVLLERVLGNLIANALRYTQQGGALVAVRRGASGVRLQVVDTGIGIAPEDQPRIFDEFVQLHNPQRSEREGVGLGLATVQRVCRLLGHPLHLRSRLGRGSVFTLQLPVAAPPATGSSMPAVADVVPLRGRVLLVEDNALVRESLTHSLQRWGLEVCALADASTALHRLAGGNFHVVLTDARLPGALQGLELLHQVGQAAPRCLRLLMTGEPEQSLGVLPQGVMLLRKPVRPLRLRALLGMHLEAPEGAIVVG